MSFILDALKKSEAARQRQMTPGLIEPGFKAPRRGLPLWAIALLILLGINLIVLSVILVGRATRASNEAAATPTAAPAPAPASTSTSTPASTPAPAPMPAPAPAPTAKPFSPMDGSPVDAPEIPLSPAGSAAALPRRRSAAPPAPSTPLRARPRPVEDEEILPTIDALNLRGADALPPLHLDVHVYATNPADRFVYINSHKYAEGSMLREGPTVERIRRDGVVLNYHGIRFLLPRR